MLSTPRAATTTARTGASSFALLAASVFFAGAAATPARAQDAPTGLTVGGLLEANYTYNFNRPANGSNTFLYNQKEGQFAINLAQVQVSKAATPASRTGFVLRLIDGEVRKGNFNLGEGSNTDPQQLPNILEAYGTFLVPFRGRDLKVDVGQFVTHVGYETIEVGTNNFFSRNFLFQYPSPFYNAGVRAALPLGSRTTVTGFILNRYNGTNDTRNRDLAPGFQIAQTLSPRSTLVLNGLTSRENILYKGTGPGGSFSSPDLDDDGGETNNLTALSRRASRQVSGDDNLLNRQQSVLDLVYSNQFSPSTRVVVEGLYRFGKDVLDESYNVFGVAGYGIFTFPNGNVAAIRGEYLRQSRVFDTSLGFGILPQGDSDKKPSLSSITASYELKAGIFPGLRTLFEVRFDSAYDEIFPTKSDVKKSQTTFTIGQIFSF